MNNSPVTPPSTTCTLTPVSKGEWGPCGWRFLDAVFKASSNCDASNLESFMKAMAAILPCMECRTNMQKFIQNNPMTTYFSSYKGRQKWLAMLKQASGAKDSDKKKYVYWLLGIAGGIVAVALVMYLLYRRR